MWSVRTELTNEWKYENKKQLEHNGHWNYKINKIKENIYLMNTSFLLSSY